MSDIITKIESLNQRANAINQKRERLLGRIQTVDSQLEAGLKDYNNSFKKNLNEKGIIKEYEQVHEKYSKEAEKMEELITRIENGDYYEKKLEQGETTEVEEIEAVEVAVKTSGEVVQQEEETTEEIEAEIVDVEVTEEDELDIEIDETDEDDSDIIIDVDEDGEEEDDLEIIDSEEDEDDVIEMEIELGSSVSIQKQIKVEDNPDIEFEDDGLDFLFDDIKEKINFKK
jgi:hypothetical protein